jgi:hypothetical protein
MLSGTRAVILFVSRAVEVTDRGGSSAELAGAQPESE